MNHQQFVGRKAVLKVEDDDRLEWVKVTFRDGTWQVLNREIFDATKDRKEYDLTTLRDRRMHVVARKVLELLLRYRVRVDEVEYLNTLVVTSLTEHLNNANRLLWAREGEKRRELSERDVGDIDSILNAQAE